MSYDEMSDLEINMAVAKLEGYKVKRYDLRNYCNSWEDMGPIMVESKISLIFHEPCGRWFATTEFNSWLNVEPHFNKNPLRAAAITYLRNKGQ